MEEIDYKYAIKYLLKYDLRIKYLLDELDLTPNKGAAGLKIKNTDDDFLDIIHHELCDDDVLPTWVTKHGEWGPNNRKERARMFNVLKKIYGFFIQDKSSKEYRLAKKKWKNGVDPMLIFDARADHLLLQQDLISLIFHDQEVIDMLDTVSFSGVKGAYLPTLKNLQCDGDLMRILHSKLGWTDLSPQTIFETLQTIYPRFVDKNDAKKIEATRRRYREAVAVREFEPDQEHEEKVSDDDCLEVNLIGSSYIS
jgi:hypothetical protein